MRIVDRKTFLALPENTLYSKYVPMAFGPIAIKMESVGKNDFYSLGIEDSIDVSESSVFIDALLNVEVNITNIRMDLHSSCRDGLYDDDQLFAVWGKDDVKSLIERLKECLGG